MYDNPVSWIVLFVFAIIFTALFIRCAINEKIQKDIEDDKFWYNYDRR